MKLAPKPQYQNVTKVDYLTVTFCPAEIQRLKTMAKWHVSTGEYKHYREAYNALICSEIFSEDGTDDFDLVNETKVVQVHAIATLIKFKGYPYHYLFAAYSALCSVAHFFAVFLDFYYLDFYCFYSLVFSFLSLTFSCEIFTPSSLYRFVLARYN